MASIQLRINENTIIVVAVVVIVRIHHAIVCALTEDTYFWI
jgi:hypothetical protein